MKSLLLLAYVFVLLLMDFPSLDGIQIAGLCLGALVLVLMFYESYLDKQP